MHPRVVASAFALLVLHLSCSPAPPRERGQPGPSRPVIAADPRAPAVEVRAGGLDPGEAPAAPARVLAWTHDDRLAVIDATTGALVSATGATEGATDRDVAWDGWSGRALVMEGADGSGEIAVVPLDRALRLGAREHVAWVDGNARIASAPGGIVSFEQGYGLRWKVLWNDGVPGSSAAASLPLSMTTTLEEGAIVVRALSFGASEPGTKLARFEARVADHAIVITSAFEIDGAVGASPPSVRHVATPDGELLIEAADGSITLSSLEGDTRGPPMRLDVARKVGAIEHALALASGRVVILTSDPGCIVAVDRDRRGAPRALAVLDLPAPVRASERFFSRAMLAVGEARLLVATEQGVLAVDVIEGADLGLSIDASFEGSALRGPLDGPLRRQPGPPSSHASRTGAARSSERVHQIERPTPI